MRPSTRARLFDFLLIVAAVFALIASLPAQVPIRIEWQDGSALERVVEPGWTHLDGPLGAHLFDDGERACLRLTAGVADAPGAVGSVFFSRIVVDTGEESPVIVQRAGWVVEGSRITVGSGAECIPPRGSLRIRWARAGFSVAPPPPTQWVFRVGDLEIPLPESVAAREQWRVQRMLDALRDGAADWVGARLSGPALGLWHPLGQPYTTSPGADGIEPITGWERRWELAVLRSDLVMERQAVDCLRAADGEPLAPDEIESRGYCLDRGWSKVGQIARFCEPVTQDPYDDRRRPLRWNEGAAPYFDAIHGIDRYSQFLPHDGMHLIRATGPAEAGAQLWADECCALDLRVMAADARLAYRDLPTVQAGKGSSLLGRREPAWCAWTMLAADAEDAFALAFVGRARTAQMPSGIVMRLASDNGVLGGNWALSPNGWVVDGNGITSALSAKHDLFQRMEQDFAVYAFARAGEWGAAEKGARIYLPRGARPSIIREAGAFKFGACADLHGAPHRAVMFVTKGAGDYFGHLVPGLMACKALQDGQDPTRWIQALLDVPTPSGNRASTAAELRALIASDSIGPAWAIAALSALERVQ